MQQIRIGLIGCGNIAHHHVQRLLPLEGVQLVGMADPSQKGMEVLQATFQLTNVQQFMDYTTMLEQCKPDAVVICSPHTLHVQHAIDAIRAGAHVLIEKPMACHQEEAEQLIACAEQHGKKLQVSFQRHFIPAFMYIRETIAAGVIGSLTSVTATLHQNWKDAQQGTWRQDVSLSGGGMLMDSGCHIMDALLWTTQLKPCAIAAKIASHGAPVEVDTSISIRFEGGVIGGVQVIGQAPLRKLKESYMYVGERGAISYDNGRVVLQLNGQEAIEPALPTAITDPDRSFVDAIRGKHEVLISGAYALEVVGLIDAIYASGGYDPRSPISAAAGRDS